MSDENTQPTSETVAEEKPNNGNDMSWLADRLERAKRSAVSELLSGIGVANAEELQGLIQAHRERQAAEMTELEQAQQEVEQLRAEQARAARLADVVTQTLQRELEAIPEDKRDVIQGNTPEERLADLTRLKALGVFDTSKKFPPPKLDADAGVTSSGNGASEEDVTWAKLLGMSVEKYLQRKKESEEER